MGKTEKPKDAPISVKSDDWITSEIRQNCVGTVDGKNKVLVKNGKLTINFDVLVPGKSLGTGALAESNLKYAQDAVRPTLAAFKKLVSGHLSDGLNKVVEIHGGDDAKGYTKASGILDKLNKFIKENLDDLRSNMRKAVAKKLGISPKELLTIGTTRFKEMKIEPGVFADEVNLDDKSSADVSAALTKKGWQYCGVACSTKTAIVGIDNKKKFNETELKELKEILDKKSASLAAGRVKADSQTNVAFEFLEKDKSTLPAGIQKTLRLALNIQTGKKMSYVGVEFVPTYSADKKGKKDAGDAKKK